MMAGGMKVNVKDHGRIQEAAETLTAFALRHLLDKRRLRAQALVRAGHSGRR